MTTGVELVARAIPLYPYQLDVLLSTRKMVSWLASRRIGKSFTVSLRAVLRALGVICRRPHSQYIFAPGVAQAARLLADCHMHLRALEVVLGRKLIVSAARTRIELVNGKELLALPNNVMTVRGYGGDVIFEEAGAIPGAKELYQAAKPIADPTPADPGGHTVIANGTGLGDDSWFHDIMETDAGARWEHHRTPYRKAMDQGFPGESPEDVRAEVGSDAYEVEYNCGWILAGQQYFSTELIDAVCYQTEEMEVPKGLRTRKMPRLPAQVVPIGAGYDVARRRHLSAACEWSRSNDARLWITGSRTERNMPWSEQEAWVGDVTRRCGRVAVDATGMGDQFTERLENVYGKSRILRVEFNRGVMANLMTGLKLGFERRTALLPADNLDLRRSLATIRRQVTAQNNIKFDADETDKTGHGDLAVAAALGLWASGGAAKEPLSDQPVGQLDTTRRPAPLGRGRTKMDGI